MKNPQLLVRLTWNIDTRKDESPFTMLCRGKEECLSRMNSKNPTRVRTNVKLIFLVAIIEINFYQNHLLLQKTSRDFTNLKFNSEYTFGVKGTRLSSSNFSISKTFLTPTCEKFCQKYPLIKLNCLKIMNMQKLRKHGNN